jgi:uncharacterized protein (DUF1697 family)
MRDLCQLCTDAGLEDVRSLLQSGNVVFRSAHGTTEKLERLLEKAAQRELGLTTAVMVRTCAEWEAMIAANPFPGEAARDPGHLLALSLKNPPVVTAVAALQRAITGREVVRAKGSTLYAVYPDGIGRSKLTNVLMEKHLGVSMTGRNWNTVLKIAAAMGGLPSD